MKKNNQKQENVTKETENGSRLDLDRVVPGETERGQIYYKNVLVDTGYSDSSIRDRQPQNIVPSRAARILFLSPVKADLIKRINPSHVNCLAL